MTPPNPGAERDHEGAQGDRRRTLPGSRTAGCAKEVPARPVGWLLSFGGQSAAGPGELHLLLPDGGLCRPGPHHVSLPTSVCQKTFSGQPSHQRRVRAWDVNKKPGIFYTLLWVAKERLTTDQSKLNGAYFLIKVRGALPIQTLGRASCQACSWRGHVWAGVRAKRRRSSFPGKPWCCLQHPEFEFCHLLAGPVRPWAARPLTCECLLVTASEIQGRRRLGSIQATNIYLHLFSTF